MSAVRKPASASALPTRITPALLRKLRLPRVDDGAGKEGRGCVLVVGGSQEIPGAVVLAATAALRAGAGKLQIATSRAVAPAVAVSFPEARVIGLPQDVRGELAPRPQRRLARELAQCNALLVGPGMVRPDAGVDLAHACLLRKEPPTLIVDAAALALFEHRRRARAAQRAIIATPHAGEMAQLWGVSREEVTRDPRALAQQAAVHLGIVLALKGADTYVAAPDGRVFHNTAGNSGLGTSGSGDTLSGIIAGLCARGADPVQAAVWGVYLHARAGEILAKKVGPLGFLARELLAEIPGILATLSQ